MRHLALDVDKTWPLNLRLSPCVSGRLFAADVHLSQPSPGVSAHNVVARRVVAGIWV